MMTSIIIRREAAFPHHGEHHKINRPPSVSCIASCRHCTVVAVIVSGAAWSSVFSESLLCVCCCRWVVIAGAVVVAGVVAVVLGCCACWPCVVCVLTGRHCWIIGLPSVGHVDGPCAVSNAEGKHMFMSAWILATHCTCAAYTSASMSRRQRTGMGAHPYDSLQDARQSRDSGLRPLRSSCGKSVNTPVLCQSRVSLRQSSTPSVVGEASHTRNAPVIGCGLASKCRCCCLQQRAWAGNPVNTPADLRQLASHTSARGVVCKSASSLRATHVLFLADVVVGSGFVIIKLWRCRPVFWHAL